MRINFSIATRCAYFYVANVRLYPLIPLLTQCLFFSDSCNAECHLLHLADLMGSGHHFYFSRERLTII
jgi:hypothetical protein